MERRTAEQSERWLAIRRALLLVLPVLYIAFASVRAAEDSRVAWVGITAALVVALLAGRRVATGRGATIAPLAITLATAALSTRHAWASCAREALLAAGSLAAVNALAAIEPDAGLAPRAVDALMAKAIPLKTIARAAATLAVLGWAAAALLDGLAWLRVAPGWSVMAPAAAAAGGAMSLLVVGVFGLLLAGARRLELGAPPRALAGAAAAFVGLAGAVALGLGTSVHADGAVALGAAVALPFVVRFAGARDAAVVARRGRRAVTLALFGGPVAMLAAIAVEGRMQGVALMALTIALAAVLVGAIAPVLEEPLLPARGALLSAFAEAGVAARDRDAREAITKALLRIREAAGRDARSPELWMLHPTRICTVDAAGYLKEEDAELPPALLDIARAEPHDTIRVDVLRELEVRRADLRPLLHWLEGRGALFATLVSGGEEPDGVLIVPAGYRSDPLTVEEVRAAKLLADGFVSVCQARSARQRHLIHERELTGRIEGLEDEIAGYRHAVTLDAGRNELAATRLARPATVGVYSAASRMAYDALEGRIAKGAPVVIVARAGVDPVPYIARAHLTGPRKSGPLVVVDGTHSREHDKARWSDANASPLALADRGLLVLVDGASLPIEVQSIIARALTERRPPWERATPLDLAVALTATLPPNTLVDYGQLAPELFARFDDATPIELPGLSDRPEDLFSIVADRIAREGLRVHGRPFGIDSAAFARLMEHPFEGEDAELASIVSRLVARARGDVVRVIDVEAIGISVPRRSTRPPRAS